MTVEIRGTVAAGFEKVADEFEANFTERGDVGAACSVLVGGETVVDLWAGVADPASGRPYEADTLQLVFSSTKGVMAIAAHTLAAQGRLDLDAPVSEYWPEFVGAGGLGKEAITVRSVLGHRSGMVGLDRVLSLDEFCTWESVVGALAEAAPVWEPGSAHGYHALTFGFLVGEIIRRITGQLPGEYVQQHVADPVGAEFAIGVDDEQLGRVAPLIEFSPDALGADPDPTITAILTPGSPTNRAFLIAPVWITNFNQEPLLRAQIPSANGCTSARSLARIYASTVSTVDGVRLLDAEQVDGLRAEQSAGDDLVLVTAPNRIGAGVFLPDPVQQMIGPNSFGHSGLGGSLGCADVDREIGFGYVMNQCRPEVRGDPRGRALVDAVLACTA
jgi:CubicO group peptidase (beta-lactamase class C family)